VPVALERATVWTGAGGTPFHRPFAIAVDPTSGEVLVTDVGNQRVAVLAPDGGTKRVLAPQADAAVLRKATGIAVAADGGIWVADYLDDRIRRLDRDGVVLTEWGEPGTDAGALSAPCGLAVGPDGSIFVADFAGSQIEVVAADGTHRATIGRPGPIGPGALDHPTDVAVDADGRILVADAYHHRIQRFRPDGEPEASWGRHLAWLVSRPDGDTTGLSIPTGVCAVPDSDLMAVADSGNGRVLLLDGEGRVVDAWTLPNAGEDGDGGWHSPIGVAAAPDGRRLYLTDFAGDRVIVLRVVREGVEE